MIGRDTGKTYNLGERISRQVKGVDRLAGAVDFLIPEADSGEEG